MATQSRTATAPERESTVEEKVKRLREVFADAPELGKQALVNVLRELISEVSETPPQPIGGAGRVGARVGKVSELSVILTLAPGGAERVRAFLRLLGGNLNKANAVGTVHDMRMVIFDNDTRMLFATTFDGEWDPYIDDFSTKIADDLDLFFCNAEGWPGIRDPNVKDWIAERQVSAEGWYVGSPNLTVTETRRLERVGKALDEFLDKISE